MEMAGATASRPVKAFTLLYHDVVENGDLDTSGFPGSAAGRYKLDATEFRRHLREIARTHPNSAISATSLVPPSPEEHPPDGSFLITFDDGGMSALSRVAPLLEELGWVGHFLITVDRLGQPGFMSRDDVRELADRGHVIGSHSFTHPERMAALGKVELRQEWKRSVDVLSETLGHRVRVASVPGGYYSKRVAKSAADEGIEVLFTSEPTTRVRQVSDCWVFGRYTLWRGADPVQVRRLIAGSGLERLRRAMRWNAKKPFKMVAGPAYQTIRSFLLGESRPG